jgi:MFS family permease
VRTVLLRRDLALVWLGGLISLTGDRALLIALPVFVYQQTGSTLATAAMFTANYLPSVLLGTIAGVFVDRWSRKQIMVVTNLMQGVVMLLLLLVRSGEWLWLVYLVIFVETCIAMFFQPAEGALLPSLIGEEQLVQANALVGLNNNIARLAGPALGGLLIGIFGLQSVALFDSASFLIAGGMIALISATAPPASDNQPGEVASAWMRMWREWRDGLRLVVRSRAIAVLFLVVNLTSFGGAMIDPLYTPFMLDVVHADAVALGWLSTATAIGGIFGGLLLGRFGLRARPIYLVGVGTIVAGICLLVMYHLTVLSGVLVFGFLLGIPLVGSNAGLETFAQTNTPDRYRGRVFGAIGTTNALVGLASLAISGIFGEIVGIVPMLTVAAGITICAGIVALVAIPWAEASRGGTKEASTVA